MSVLTELIAALGRAADQLEQGNVYQQAWAKHLRDDRGAMLLLEAGWQPPAPAEVEAR